MVRVGPSSNLKTLHPLQVFSTLPPPPSSTLSSTMKIKTLIHSLIFSHVCRVIRCLNKARSKALSIIIQVLRDSQPMQLIYPTKKNKNKNKTKKIFFGSFRLHYNWCSSTHVLPVPARVYDGLTATHLYYDSTWNSVISTDGQQCEDNFGPESQLSGYLQWLEEKKKVHDNNNSMSDDQTDANEIDKLADLFIAKSHEKFILEKQESYRRFQEMIARSM